MMSKGVKMKLSRLVGTSICYPDPVAKLQSNLLVTRTWNVRTLIFLEIGKLDNIEREIRNMQVNILGLCETRLTGAGEML